MYYTNGKYDMYYTKDCIYLLGRRPIVILTLLYYTLTRKTESRHGNTHLYGKGP